RVFESFAARLAHRDRCDLYHSALEVRNPEGRFVIEQAPAWSESSERGVVAEGAVGARAASRFRLFRYEIRCWRDGVIPDVGEALESPRRLGDDPDQARRLLELVQQVPTPVWGRDELRTGEMWNSNSLISWLITRSGLDVDSIRPPIGGRAPGWHAGMALRRARSRSRRPPRRYGLGSRRWGRIRAAAPTPTTGSRTCSASTCTRPTPCSRSTSTRRLARASAMAPTR